MSVAALSSSSDRPGVGDTVTLNTTVINHGTDALNNVVVRFYDGDPANGGVEIGSGVVDALAGGASKAVSVNWAPTTSGSRTLYVVADPANTLGDTEQGGNRATLAQTVHTYFTYRSTARLVGNRTDDGRDVHKWYAFDTGVPMVPVEQ